LYDFRYQRGNRSLADNLANLKSANTNEAIEQTQTTTNAMNDEDYDIPDIIEDIIGKIFKGVMFKLFALWLQYH
jgi:hypothetical protein